MLPHDLWAGLGLSLAVLAGASVLTWLFRPARTLPMLMPLALGYFLGSGGFDLLDGPLASRTVQLVLGMGAGWLALHAASSGLATFRRSPSRNAAYWALGIALLGPTLIAAGMAPLAVSIMGAGGIALHALGIAGAAANLADPAPFKSSALGAVVPADRLRDSVRTSEAMHTMALLVFPAIWGVGRTMAIGDEMRVDDLLASVGASYGIGLVLGLIGFGLIRYMKYELATAGMMLLIVALAAAVADAFTVSTVGTCFVAGLITGQPEAQRKTYSAAAHNLLAPFRLMMLVAAGASAPAWAGIARPLQIVAVVLAGRFVMGKIADTIAGARSGVGKGRHFAWLALPPSALAAAMIAESAVLFGSLVDRDGLTGGSAPLQAMETLADLTTKPALAVVAPVLLALAISDLLYEAILVRQFPLALQKAKAASAKEHHGRRHHRKRRHRK